MLLLNMKFFFRIGCQFPQFQIPVHSSAKNTAAGSEAIRCLRPALGFRKLYYIREENQIEELPLFSIAFIAEI